MNKTKKVILIFIIIINIVINTGCWSYREIEQMAIASGIAIEKGKEENTFKVTIETLNLSTETRDISVSSELYSAEANTVFEAVRNIVQATGKKIYWAHAKVLIISDGIAEKGIISALDWIKRDSEPRSDIWLLISKQATASEIFKNRDQKSGIISYRLNDIMTNNKITHRYPEVTLWDFANQLTAKGSSAYAPTVFVDYKEDKPYLKVGGTAVFKKGMLVGYLNEAETKNLLFLRDKVDKGVIVVNELAGTNENVTLELFDSKTKLEPVEKDNKITMKVNIKITAAIDEIQGSYDVIEKKGREKLKKEAENKLKDSIQNTISKVQNQYKADIFGFGRDVKMKMPSVWKDIESSAEKREDFFTTLYTEVNVDLTIKGSAKLSKTLNIGD